MSSTNGETVGRSPVTDSLAVLFSCSEALGQLVRGQPLMKVGIGGVVKLVEKIVQFGLVAKRKTDRKTDLFVGGHSANGSKPVCGCRPRVLQNLATCGKGRCTRENEDKPGRDKSRG